MKLDNRDLQRVMQYLRNVAEVDPNDVVSNCASQLAYELETVRAPFDTDTLNEKRHELIKYAISKRNTYVLLPGAKHACIVS
jgi:Asp-tRNA(Asn)/Glu-tRNA(Gln) amidotransferase C subunit